MDGVTSTSTAAVKVRPVNALGPPELRHFILGEPGIAAGVDTALR